MIADLEERRDAKLGAIITGFQASAKGYLARRSYRRAHGKAEAIYVIQRNVSVYLELYDWSWWKLFRQVKPLLGVFRQEEQEKAIKAKIDELQRRLEEEILQRTALEAKVEK